MCWWHHCMWHWPGTKKRANFHTSDSSRTPPCLLYVHVPLGLMEKGKTERVGMKEDARGTPRWMDNSPLPHPHVFGFHRHKTILANR